MAVRILCADCGGTTVTRDAWAEWDMDRQEWVLGAVFDDGFCHTCERAATLVGQPILAVVQNGD